MIMNIVKVCIILSVFAGVFSIMSIFFDKKTKEVYICLLLSTLIFIGLIQYVRAYKVQEVKEQQEYINMVLDKAKSGYKVYLNGQLVDINTVDITQCEISMINQRQIIKLTIK